MSLSRALPVRFSARITAHNPVRSAILAMLGCLALLTFSAVPAGAAVNVTAAAPVCDDTCKVAAAESYVVALYTHDPSGVPLAPLCLRTELGLPTGLTGADIRWQLRYGPQYAIITGASISSASVAGDVVTLDYVLTLRAGSVSLGTSTVHETFRVRNGLIDRIDADFGYELPR